MPRQLTAAFHRRMIDYWNSAHYALNGWCEFRQRHASYHFSKRTLKTSADAHPRRSEMIAAKAIKTLTHPDNIGETANGGMQGLYCPPMKEDDDYDGRRRPLVCKLAVGKNLISPFDRTAKEEWQREKNGAILRRSADYFPLGRCAYYDG